MTAEHVEINPTNSAFNWSAFAKHLSFKQGFKRYFIN